MTERGWVFLHCAGTLILAASILVWAALVFLSVRGGLYAIRTTPARPPDNNSAAASSAAPGR